MCGAKRSANAGMSDENTGKIPIPDDNYISSIISRMEE